MDQTNILNDIITITNVSRGLINENINKINKIIDYYYWSQPNNRLFNCNKLNLSTLLEDSC